MSASSPDGHAQPEASAPPGGWAATAVLAVGFGALIAGGAGAALVLSRARAVIGPLVACLALGLLTTRRESWWPALREHGQRCGEALDRIGAARPGPWIALAAGTALAAELFLIRWHASSFQLFSYFKNVSLLASFLGLGIGYALGRTRPLLLGLALPAVSLQVLALHVLGSSPIQDQLQSPISEQLALGLVDSPTLGHWLLTYGVLVAVFLLSVLTLLPFGHLAGWLMDRLPPVAAYGWNLAGSLLAAIAFALLAEAWSPPSIWLLAVAGGFIPFLVRACSPRATLIGLASIGIALTVLAPRRTDAVDVYSPYQVLTLRLNPVAPSLLVNHAYFQQIWNLGTDRVRDAEHAQVARHYDLPYALRPRPGRVLVVGSGTGNDVAAALRNGAAAVDAVEIDPAILALGRLLHPERPYYDRRVTAHVEDARSFIRHSDSRYDLIVYGLLDSHTVLSGASSVRLDSYVYTVEAFREARARLSQDGVLVMTFTLLSREIAWKLFLMLREAFDADPRAFETVYDGGITFVAGPGVPHGPLPGVPFAEVSDRMLAARLEADVSTDDWPFLYMPVRRYPLSYLVMAGVLTAASVVVLVALLPVSRRSFSGVSFFLGAGFMLLETKAITELALVFGSTWQVTSTVIVGILVMAMLANFWVGRVGTRHPELLYALIGVSILAGLVFPVRSWGLPATAERVAATALATLPLLFSGTAFSTELLRRGQASSLLSWNLMGAMLGGLLEYNSLFLGLQKLGIVALLLYAAAFAASQLRR